MPSTLSSPAVASVLGRFHAQADEEDPDAAQRVRHARQRSAFLDGRNDLYLPVPAPPRVASIACWPSATRRAPQDPHTTAAP